ncbi:hypothetical protein, partial [Vibrio parahaemolyticus]|uniref:hypothetical protein n=1 Tax=Vibrio parahaemolyticus TaxID=670 RepID=UPI001C5FAE7C
MPHPLSLSPPCLKPQQFDSNQYWLTSYNYCDIVVASCLLFLFTASFIFHLPQVPTKIPSFIQSSPSVLITKKSALRVDDIRHHRSKKALLEANYHEHLNASFFCRAIFMSNTQQNRFEIDLALD